MVREPLQRMVSHYYYFLMSLAIMKQLHHLTNMLEQCRRELSLMASVVEVVQLSAESLLHEPVYRLSWADAPPFR